MTSQRKLNINRLESQCRDIRWKWIMYSNLVIPGLIWCLMGILATESVEGLYDRSLLTFPATVLGSNMPVNADWGREVPHASRQRRSRQEQMDLLGKG